MAATLMTTALAACASPAPMAAGQGAVAQPLRVTNNGAPFSYDQGAQAKRVAMDTCAANGRVLRPSIYDRFDGGEWVFVEGCA